MMHQLYATCLQWIITISYMCSKKDFYWLDLMENSLQQFFTIAFDSKISNVYGLNNTSFEKWTAIDYYSL